MNHNAFKSGRVVTNLLIAVVFVAACSLAWVGASSANQPTANRSNDRAIAVAAAVSLGLDPDALAASGLTAGQARTVISSLRGHLEERGGEFSAKQAAYRAALQRVAETDSLVSRGQAARGADPARAAREALKAAASERKAAEAAAWASIAPSLTVEQGRALQSIRRQRGSGLPLEFLTVQRTPGTIEAIREAPGQLTDAAPVTLARTQLAANRTAIAAVWQQELLGD